MPKGYFCKVNISNPATGAQKSFTIEDFRKYQTLHGLRMASEFDGAVLGDEYADCTFRITGGNDGQGFPMYQGVLKTQRARLLLKEGCKGCHFKRPGERRRRSVRGCIVGPDLHALSLVLVDSKGKTIEGLTDVTVPKRLLPKRASRIRKLFGLPSRKVDPKDQAIVCDLIREIGRQVTSKNGVTRTKYPKVQRVVTDEKYAKKHALLKARYEARERSKQQAVEYRALLQKLGRPCHLGKDARLTKEKFKKH
ncbi:Ribosomal protein S6e [Giardia muris]|uniref:40S ribosomal protein S6 n=1 Tax=Giardia muris TaxID=5742 RepID=A0A4Z1SMA7_GIAMU|nr:Ribosomal protein S6e [Giardia muris]|eukprot:TNJ26824.1 Ribosomal protein S6e [Giardia muris]